MTNGYRMCTRCIMDTSDPAIRFDEAGVCNHCHTFDLQQRRDLKSYRELEATAETIRRRGKGKPYDCILGLSGGGDSSYVALVAHRLGLRCLAVHMDNGWNSELAVQNIENIVTTLGFDLYTHVIDWEEFRDLQRAYVKAAVVDIEALTDHAITATMYRLARKYRVKYLLSGNNIVTESVMPPAWVHRKSDLANIKAIHRRFGEVPMQTFPTCSTRRIFALQLFCGIRVVNVLNHIDYLLARARRELKEQVGWREYGGKHHESLFTRFYQACLLPRKFGIDKRRAHYSNLVLSGQLDRSEALGKMAEPPLPPDQCAQDQAYVGKKLGFDHEEFERYLQEPGRSHRDYPHDDKTFERIVKWRRLLSPVLG
jgi:N-acetyl sugar amidotransferase